MYFEHLSIKDAALTWPTSEELKDKVEDIVEVVWPLGRFPRRVVAVAVLWRRAVAKCVQGVGHLRDVRALRLLLGSSANPACHRPRGMKCHQC